MASELRHHFWDTSSIVPLLVREPETDRRTSELRSCPEMIVWWGTRLECVSALARRKRETSIGSEAFDQALARLDLLCEQWHSVAPSSALLSRAERLLRIHPLRAADAFQLSAALIAVNEQTKGVAFYVSDHRLSEAARQEGFTVL